MHRIGIHPALVTLKTTFANANDALRRVKLRLENRFGLLDDLVVEPFRSWGNDRVIHIHGRLLESKGIAEPREDDSIARGIHNTIRRLDSDEIPDAELHISFGDLLTTARTDSEGYFRLDLHLDEPLRPGWHRVQVELIDSMAGGAGTSADAEIMIPDPASQYAVISDLDDTVVVTGATDRLRMMRIILMKDAHDRSIFPGVEAFYRALRAGRAGYPDNAFFYITRTGWNLYDLFIQIMERHEIPPGAVLMQELSRFGPPAESWSETQSKDQWIERLFEELPHRFVLIGDSGQRDPETYLRCVERWPERVAAIFVRDVTTPRRDREVHAIARQAEKMGVPVSVTDCTVEMARQAVQFGLIEAGAVGTVERAVRSAAEEGS